METEGSWSNNKTLSLTVINEGSSGRLSSMKAAQEAQDAAPHEACLRVSTMVCLTREVKEGGSGACMVPE